MSTLGFTITVLATQLAEAHRKDSLPDSEGFDINAGLFGIEVSNWLRETAKNFDYLVRENQELRKELEKRK